MPLTDTAIKSTKPSGKTAKLFDGGGLYLEVAPSGGKWWRFKYRFGGKEKRLSLGVYPDVGLKLARDRREAARKLLVNNVDPGEHRKATKAAESDRAANSFEVLARKWFAKYEPNWAKSHADKIISRLERDMFPWIGSKAVSDLRAPELLACLRRIEHRGAVDTAHRALQNCGQIFRYAVATGRAERNPTSDLRGALPPYKQQHLASITDPKEVAACMRWL
jgi:hypothetical protein